MGELIRAIAKVGSGSLVSMVMGAIMMKLIALGMGPSGVGVYSIFRQIQQLFLSVATVGGNTAIVQGVSSREENDANMYIATVGKVFVFTVTITILIYLLSISYVYDKFFADNPVISYDSLLLCLIPSVLSCFSVFLLSVLNGCRKIEAVAIQQITATTAGAVFAYPFSIILMPDNLYLLLGLTFLFSIISSTYFFINYGLIYKLKIIVSASWDVGSIRSFGSIAIGNLLVVASGAATLFYIRLVVLERGSLVDAGLFDASWSISMTYVVLLLGAFSTYYLPKMSSIRSNDARDELISMVLKITTILSMLLVSMVVIFKPLVVVILYSKSFLPSLNLMQWMLIGDYLKILGWVLSIPLIAFMYTKIYVFVSLLFNLIVISASILSASGSNSEWFGIAYIIANLMYVTFLTFYWFFYQNVKIRFDICIKWVLSFIVVLALSYFHWNEQTLGFMKIVISMVFLVACTLFLLGKKDFLLLYQNAKIILKQRKI